MNPQPFFKFSKETCPNDYHPTKVHCFIRLLHEKGLLLRDYTQNIDTLEFVAGIPDEMVVTAHGSFRQAHCIECHKEHTYEYFKAAIDADRVPHCTDPACPGFVKPDIVFFGESLPELFFPRRAEDFPQCDLLIVLGTGLAVQPFASLVADVGEDVPRVLINREVVDARHYAPDASERLQYEYRRSSSFKFDHPENRRDVLLQGDCDTWVEKLCDKLGWREELETIYHSLDKPSKE